MLYFSISDLIQTSKPSCLKYSKILFCRILIISRTGNQIPRPVPSDS